MTLSVDANGPQSLYNIWSAASVVLGFQFAAFAWRMTRQREMAHRGEPTWLPVADKMNMLSISVIVLGTFVAPILNILNILGVSPGLCFALGLLILAAYPFALAGPYKLFGKGWDNRKEYFPGQEIVVVVITILALLAALCWKLVSSY